MSADKSEAQKDITKWASTDGHFRRQVSSFRDVIEKGGKFEPEKGKLGHELPCGGTRSLMVGPAGQAGIIFLCHMRARGRIAY